MKAWKQNGCGICCRGKWDREGKTLTTFSESINFPCNDRPYRKYTYEKKNPLIIDYELSTIIFKYTTKQSELKYHWFFKKSVLKKSCSDGFSLLTVINSRVTVRYMVLLFYCSQFKSTRKESQFAIFSIFFSCCWESEKNPCQVHVASGLS